MNNMENEEIYLTANCACCSALFEVTPDCFVEIGVFATDSSEGDFDAMELCSSLADATAEDLVGMGLDEAARDAMMNARVGEHIAIGAQAICPTCMQWTDEVDEDQAA